MVFVITRVHSGHLEPGTRSMVGPDVRRRLGQSAIDRLKSGAYELVLEGESCRQRENPGLPVSTIPPTPSPLLT
jgi:hypothetical protein